ncbi:MAG: hypothetical protein EAX96_19860 [Candidatus Lokiarchaeota archaeon]|nr:hypothetical protein [Candidatus Lokiarchaeota archaeon]
MKYSDAKQEFESWMKFHKYLSLEQEGHIFSNEEYEEIFLLLNNLALKKGKNIEDCVKKNGIQRVLVYSMLKEPC